MNIYGKASISEFLEDFIVYRNITPVDTRLPGLPHICKILGLTFTHVPRKTSTEYASVLSYMLKEARALNAPSQKIERVVLIGDTRMNDGSAFLNICHSGGWKGMAFIGSEKDEPEKWEVEKEAEETIISSNRWNALDRFNNEMKKNGFLVNENTAILIDLDKTALGARGRNDRVIDHARVNAARCVAEKKLGQEFDLKSFQTAYNLLNQPEFHFFTSDNQDYLVYICLLLGTSLFDFLDFVEKVRSGRYVSFNEFIEEVEKHRNELPDQLQTTHTAFYENWQMGDPTPFKEFRYCEFQNTADLMGITGDDVHIDELLKSEIVITQEVREMALNWRKQGAILFGLSDKPDEASLPTDQMVAKGYKPIHQIMTHIVGE